MTDISDTLLKQRLRNRVMEGLDCFVDISAVEKLGTFEIINIWFDFTDRKQIEIYDTPVFNEEELLVLREFHSLVEGTYKKIPETWVPVELENIKAWCDLRKKAEFALGVFRKRGPFSEEIEINY